MKKNGVSVIIRAHTWARDSHGLFDYESSKVSKATIKTASPSYILRKDNEVSHVFALPEHQDSVNFLTNLQVVEGHFAISPITLPSNPRSSICEKNYLVVRCLSSTKGYQITEGDVLKMGRLKFRVKELKGADPSKRIKDFVLSDLINLKDGSEESEEEEDLPKFRLPCRICLSESYSDANPLICPCNCDGTMKYIHLKCLQRALRSKVTTRASDNTLSFSWKTMNCDLCKKPYPYHFSLGDQNIELIQIPKPPEKYVILEGLCKDKNSHKWLHVISLNSKDTIRLGRANECELRMTDISVSRLHGIIRLIGENFFLEDKGSKFGTLVQIKRPVALESSSELSIQTGRTLLTFTVKKPWSIIPACFRPSASAFDLFASPYQSGVIPLLPINSGIPLSINDPGELMARAGPNKNRDRKYQSNNNLMFEHGQLGHNSSLEEEPIDGVEAVQEIVVAAAEDGSRIISEESKERGVSEGKEQKRSHSFV